MVDDEDRVAEGGEDDLGEEEEEEDELLYGFNPYGFEPYGFEEGDMEAPSSPHKGSGSDPLLAPGGLMGGEQPLTAGRAFQVLLYGLVNVVMAIPCMYVCRLNNRVMQ